MLLKTLIIFATGITAFMLPDGAADGIYSVQHSPNGEEVHIFLNATIASDIEIPTNPSFSAPVSKRDNTGPNHITCGNYGLDAGNTNDAVANLRAQCGNGAFVNKGLSYYAKFGSVVAFYCNYRSGTNNCYSSEATAAFNSITLSCGSFVAGYDHIPDRSDTYGYQRASDSWC